MDLCTYHSHCNFCDGKAPAEDFVKAAIEAGFHSYGISSHSPLPFETRWSLSKGNVEAYLTEIKRLQEKYAGQIELYVGMEIDYLNDDWGPAVEYFQRMPLDYRIGSVHLLYDDKGEIVDVDVTADKFCRVVDKHFNGDLVRVVHLYYDRLMRMVELGGFDIVGHADKMHYNASAYHPGLLDEPWYDALIQGYFDAIARKGYIVEINTKSYLELGTFYPNERYFPVLLEKGIRVQVNSDSHYPERINNGRPQALMALQASGYHTVTEMYNNEWKDMPLLIHT